MSRHFQLAHVLSERAACIGLPASLFDVTEGPEITEALKSCQVCTVSEECHDFVAPGTSFFDGICAGSVWIDGESVNIAAAIAWQQTTLLPGNG